MTIVSRRDWLRTSAHVLGGGLGLSWINDSLLRKAQASTTLSRNPGEAAYSSAGQYGVASGEPSTDGFTIWTRLPDVVVASLQNTQVSSAEVSLRYWVARFDLDMTQPVIVSTGWVSCASSRDYTAHVEIRGLEDSQRYLYGFELEDVWKSEVGFARTLPSAHSEPERLTFAYVSCQLFGTGFYTVYQALSNDSSVDFCIHLGDSIYETVGEYYRIMHVRHDPVGSAETLDDYRSVHKKCLSDPWYREARRRFTWICIPDDHEVVNNYIGADPATHIRQRAGIQAYWEYMPIGVPKIPSIEEQSLPPQIPFRLFNFGNLATLYALNQRQFRSAPREPHSSMLGLEQTRWLCDDLKTLRHSPLSRFPRWQVLLSEVMMMPFHSPLRPKHSVRSPLESTLPVRIFDEGDQDRITSKYLDSDDSWDGYAHERTTILESAQSAQLEDTRLLVWTGDVHNLYAGELHGETGHRSGVEVTTGSITSPGVGDIFLFGTHKIAERAVMQKNKHMKAVNLKEHMYVRCVLTRNFAQFQSVCPTTIRQENAPAAIRDQLIVEHKSLTLTRI